MRGILTIVLDLAYALSLITAAAVLFGVMAGTLCNFATQLKFLFGYDDCLDVRGTCFDAGWMLMLLSCRSLHHMLLVASWAMYVQLFLVLSARLMCGS